MLEQKFEKKIFKKSPIKTPNGVLFIFKLPFPNGSYPNGFCRALWAVIHKKIKVITNKNEHSVHSYADGKG